MKLKAVFLWISVAISSSFADSYWEYNKVISYVEVSSEPGFGLVQITTTDHITYNYKYPDSAHPNNSIDGLKAVLSVALTAQTTGVATVSFLSNGALPPTTPRLIAGIAIGTP